MAEFCEACPLKGECEAPIDGVYVKEVYYLDVFKRRGLAGRFAVAVDTMGAPSEPVSYTLRFSSAHIAKEFEQRVEACTEPRTEGFAFFKRTQCGAFENEIIDYDKTPAAYLESKPHFIGRILQKHANTTGNR